MKPLLNYLHERFASDIQYFELIKDLIVRNTKQTYKAAFYLADQYTEILMYRLLKGQISSDSELAAILKPQIDQKEIEEIDRYHKVKLKWLKKLKFINSLDADKIIFVHSYRNLSYHNEIENEAIFPVLASLSLFTALKLFKSYYGINLSEIHFGSERLHILKKYSLPTDKVVYKYASRAVVTELSKKLLRKKDIENILKVDLTYRLENISTKRSNLSWLKDDATFDIGLKTTDFFDVHPYGKLSKKVYEIHYEVIRGNRNSKKLSDKVSALLYRRLRLREAARDKKIRKHLASHRASVSTNSIRLARNFLSKNYLKLPMILNRYIEIDRQIRRLEFLIETMEENFDREVQREIDIRRGK